MEHGRTFRIRADFLQDGRQIFAVVAEHGLSGKGRLPHQFRHWIQETDVGKSIDHQLDVVFVGSDNVLVLPDLRQGRLIRPDRDPMPVLSLFSGLLHAKKKVCIVVLSANRIGPIRMARRNVPRPESEFLFGDPKPTPTILVMFDSD